MQGTVQAKALRRELGQHIEGQKKPGWLEQSGPGEGCWEGRGKPETWGWRSCWEGKKGEDRELL